MICQWFFRGAAASLIAQMDFVSGFIAKREGVRGECGIGDFFVSGLLKSVDELLTVIVFVVVVGYQGAAIGKRIPVKYEKWEDSKGGFDFD